MDFVWYTVYHLLSVSSINLLEYEQHWDSFFMKFVFFIFSIKFDFFVELYTLLLKYFL